MRERAWTFTIERSAGTEASNRLINRTSGVSLTAETGCFTRDQHVTLARWDGVALPHVGYRIKAGL